MILPDFDHAIYQKLKGASALTSQIGGSANPRIYNLQAPQETPLPYVIFYHANGGVGNETPRGEYDVTYRIDVFGINRKVCYDISNACFTALHNNDVPLTGYSNYSTKVGNLQSLIESDGGVQYWRRVFDVTLRYTIS